MDKKKLREQALGLGCLFLAVCMLTSLGIWGYAKGSSEPQFKTVEELLEANRKTKELQEGQTEPTETGNEDTPETKSGTYSIDYDIDGEIILQSIVKQADKITNGARANLVTTIRGQRVDGVLKYDTVTSVSRDRYKNEMPLEFYMDTEGNRYHGCQGYWQQDGKQSLWELDALEGLDGAELQVIQRPGIFQYRVVLDGEQSMGTGTFGLVLKAMAMQAEFVNSEMWEVLFDYFTSSVADIKLEFVFDRSANLTGIEFRTNESVDVATPETGKQYTESFSFKIKLTRLENAEAIEFEVPNDYGAGRGQLGLYGFNHCAYQMNRKQVEATVGTPVDTHVGTAVETEDDSQENQSAVVSGSSTTNSAGEIDWSKVIGSGTKDITPVDEYRPKEINTGYSEALEKLGSSRMDEIVNIMVSGNTSKMDYETLGAYNGATLKANWALSWEPFGQDGWVLSYDERYYTTDENGNKIPPTDTSMVAAIRATNSKYPGVRMNVMGTVDKTVVTCKQTVETKGFDQLEIVIDTKVDGAMPPFDFAGFKLNYSGAELPIWIAGGEVQGDQNASSGSWCYLLDRSGYTMLFNVDCETQRVKDIQIILSKAYS